MHTETEARIDRVMHDPLITAALDQIMKSALTFARAEVRDPRLLRPETEVADDNLHAAYELLATAIDVHAGDRAVMEMQEAFRPADDAQMTPARNIHGSTAFYEQIYALRDVCFRLAKGRDVEKLEQAEGAEIEKKVSELAALVNEYFCPLPLQPEAVKSALGSHPGTEAVLDLVSDYRRALEAFRDTPREAEKDALDRAEEALFSRLDSEVVSEERPAPLPKSRKKTFVYNLTPTDFVGEAMEIEHMTATLRRFGLAAGALYACFNQKGEAKKKALDANRGRYDGALEMVLALVRSYGAQCFAEGQRRGLEG